MSQRSPGVLSNTRWEGFMVAVSVMTIINGVILLWPGLDSTDAVASIFQIALTPIFVGDFLARLYYADSRITYMAKGFGWADLLSVFSFNGWRLFRLFSLLRLSRYAQLNGGQRMLDKLAQRRSEGTLLGVLFLAIMTIELAAIYILRAEGKSPTSEIDTPGEALWWAWVTLSTVGYGDYVPVTTGGRIVAAVLMAIGVFVIGTGAAFLSNWFLHERPRRRREKVDTDDTLVEIRRMLEKQERITSQLHERLDELVRSRSRNTE